MPRRLVGVGELGTPRTARLAPLAMAGSDASVAKGRSVSFEQAAPEPLPEKDDEMDRAAFLDAFGNCIAQRDYNGALTICRQRLKAKPDDRYVLEMRKTVEQFLDAAEELEEEANDASGDKDREPPPELEDLQEPANRASQKAFEALFAFFQAEEKLWALGEQAVGIFWDVGQNAPAGPRRDRLIEMSVALTEALGRKLRSVDRQTGAMPPNTAAAELGSGEWLFEALGELWWRRELGLECESWMLDGCREDWASSGGSMEALIGYSLNGLHTAASSELCDILTQTWTLERSTVCGLLGDQPLPPLEYGIQAVLAEIHSRPLVEPPLTGFYECFYLMTHVVYVLNCFNGVLPSQKADCPWLYAYLERCLAFWLREVKHHASGGSLSATAAARAWASEAVDAIAEAVDCIRGQGEDGETEDVRDGIAWIIRTQEADGFFYSPSSKRPAPNDYDHVHPTWTAVAALQLDREAKSDGSPLCSAWARHCRAAAKEVDFARPPPPPQPADMGQEAEEEEEEESEESESDEDDDEGSESEDCEGRASAGPHALLGGPKGVPKSVLNLQADLKEMMALMAEDDDET
mmetsp:Transcript_17219/g.36547  ORF Transcript_17219/g.36547 Transcript_17219/m.36547 type:complete len:579 (+) Transcript_17219:2-1738(+)